jgi:hypothetical protein
MTATYVRFDPLLEPADAEAMVRLCERFGTYATYGAESAAEEGAKRRFAPGIPERYDAAIHFVRSGGRFGRREDPAVLAARTNYFRETYFYEKPIAPGIEPFLHHEGFAAAARRVYGRPLVVPSIVYANLLLPGQELALHTDVPEFRGANRTLLPQWLMVVMHHSGLFERWRRPIATGIAYFNDCAGGELAFYPDGVEAPAATLPVNFNTAVLMDTDSVFHGVDRVRGDDALPPFRRDMKLAFAGAGRWRLFEGAETLASYRWEQIRYSVSWKAYCYEDEADRRRTEQHQDDLALEGILEVLEDDLRRRGRLAGARPGENELALLLIDEYVHFPGPTPASSSAEVAR